MWQRIAAFATALAIAAMLVAAYLSYTPDSGIDVRALAGRRPAEIRVSVTQPGRTERLAVVRTDENGRARLDLEPGQYLVRAQRRYRGIEARRPRVRVQVREDGYAQVLIRYRRAS